MFFSHAGSIRNVLTNLDIDIGGTNSIGIDFSDATSNDILLLGVKISGTDATEEIGINVAGAGISCYGCVFNGCLIGVKLLATCQTFTADGCWMEANATGIELASTCSSPIITGCEIGSNTTANISDLGAVNPTWISNALFDSPTSTYMTEITTGLMDFRTQADAKSGDVGVGTPPTGVIILYLSTESSAMVLKDDSDNKLVFPT